MALRIQEITASGMPLFHSKDFGRWDCVGHLKLLRYCTVTCDDCRGKTHLVFRADFTRAMKDSKTYIASIMSNVDTNCHLCAVRIQWKNENVHTYVCYVMSDLANRLAKCGRKDYCYASRQMKTRLKDLGELDYECQHKCPKSHCRIYPKCLSYSLLDEEEEEHVVSRERLPLAYPSFEDSYHPPPPPPPPHITASLSNPKKRKRIEPPQVNDHHHRHHSQKTVKITKRKEDAEKHKEELFWKEKYETMHNFMQFILVPPLPPPLVPPPSPLPEEQQKKE